MIDTNRWLRIGTLFAAAGFPLMISGGARAQEAARPFALKVGALYAGEGAAEYPIDGLRKVGSTQAYFGASYEFVKRINQGPDVYGIYVDYIAPAPTRQSNGVDDTTNYGVGLGVSGRYRFGAGGSAARPYLGAGLGIYQISARHALGSVIKLDFEENGTTTYSFGAKLTAGVDFSSGALAELSYHALPGNQGAVLSGVSLAIGYRF